jgi:hypothetical protein
VRFPLRAMVPTTFIIAAKRHKPIIISATVQSAADIWSVGGQHHDDAGEQQGETSREPGEDTEPILHATDPALEPANDNEAAAAMFPPPSQRGTPFVWKFGSAIDED